MKNKFNIVLTLLLTTVFFAVTPVCAFNFGNIGGMLKGGGIGGGSKSLGSERDAMLVSYRLALWNFTKSLQYQFKAYKLKEEAEKMEQLSASLKGKPDLDNAGEAESEAAVATEKARKKAHEKMAEGIVLDAEGKKWLAKSIPYYTGGCVHGVKLAVLIPSWVKRAKSGIASLKSNPLNALSLIPMLKVGLVVLPG
ncbi:MAG: hypothetical protein QF745_00410, partial [Planctomycetota bacterium]|nr:hypothetical protein [Planctomycetota bacterium]